MEFSDKLLIEFSDKKRCLLILYSDASAGVTILIVERIYMHVHYQARAIHFQFVEMYAWLIKNSDPYNSMTFSDSQCNEYIGHMTSKIFIIN